MPDTIALMLQSLLEDRFKLKAHRETRELPLFELTKGGAKVKLSEDQTPPTALAAGNGARGGASTRPSGQSLFSAVEEQLGRKLEASTGPLPVLVIDSIERPSEN